MRTKPVHHIRRRREPLVPREFHDSRVVLMDPDGNVISRIPAAEFAQRGAAGGGVDGRLVRWPLPTITPEVVAQWSAAKRMSVRKRLHKLGRPLPECLTPQFSKRWHRAAG